MENPRLERLKNSALVNDALIKTAGVPGVIRTGKNTVQVVVGTTVQFVADELLALTESANPITSKALFSEVQRHETTGTAPGEWAAAGIKAPADGEWIPMEEIPDPVFSSGIMGECAGIIPSDGKIYAPVNGLVTTVAETGHAISFQYDNEEILVHVGLDTVKLNGSGFTVKVKEGETVRQGQLVMEADINYIMQKGFNPMVIIVRIEPS